MRLKALIATGIVCTASFAAAAPVQAKSDNGNGNGKVQRCEASKGKHNGFTCVTTGGESTDAVCPSGFSAFASRFDVAADTNGNGIICRSGNVSADDLG